MSKLELGNPVRIIMLQSENREKYWSPFQHLGNETRVSEREEILCLVRKHKDSDIIDITDHIDVCRCS